MNAKQRAFQAWWPMLFLKRGWPGVAWGLVVLSLGSLVGCSPLEPIIEPEVSDLQLTVDTLKTTIRDAQRTIAELRAEVDSRRQELADTQIARAQLEGRVREAERRLVEARHVIDLQREELAGSRSERERVGRTGAVLQNQLKQLQTQLSRLGSPAGEARGAGMRQPSSKRHQSRAVSSIREQPEPFDERAKGVATTAMAAPARMAVKPGDTLWNIAQRYHVPVKRLMAINQLPDNHIQAGQTLWLSASAAAGGQGQPE